MGRSNPLDDLHTEFVMKPHAARPHSLRRGMLLVALGAAALLVLAGGCGDLNDNPNPAGLSVMYQFGGSSVLSASADRSQPAAVSPAVASPSGYSPQVQSLVVGAIVITHPSGSGPNGAFTSADVGTLSETESNYLEDDATQSVQFLSIVQLPTASNTVEFRIPPPAAGSWQLIAVGTRNRLETLDDIADNSPIWYGFIGEFLNGKVLPGGTVEDPLVLEPACDVIDPVTPCP